jgi:hypothetical protein
VSHPIQFKPRRKANPFKVTQAADGRITLVTTPVTTGVRRKPPRHFESELQCAIVRWFVLNVRPEAAKLISIPNGDVRSPFVVARLKEEGMCNGAADLQLLLPAARLVWVEVKLAANKKYDVRRTDLSEEQREFHRWLAHFGHPAVVVRSVEEFADLLDREGVPYRAYPISYGALRPAPPASG